MRVRRCSKQYATYFPAYGVNCVSESLNRCVHSFTKRLTDSTSNRREAPPATAFSTTQSGNLLGNDAIATYLQGSLSATRTYVVEASPPSTGANDNGEDSTTARGLRVTLQPAHDTPQAPDHHGSATSSSLVRFRTFSAQKGVPFRRSAWTSVPQASPPKRHPPVNLQEISYRQIRCRVQATNLPRRLTISGRSSPTSPGTPPPIRVCTARGRPS